MVHVIHVQIPYLTTDQHSTEMKTGFDSTRILPLLRDMRYLG